MAGKKSKEGDKSAGQKAAAKAQLAQRIDALAAVSEQFEARSSRLFQDLQQLGGVQDELARSARELGGRIDELSERNVLLESRLRETDAHGDERIARLEARLDDVAPTEAEIQALQTRLESLELREGEQGARLAQLADLDDRLQRAMQQVKESARNAVDELERRLAEGLEEAPDITPLVTRIDAVEQEGRQQETRLEELVRRADQLEHALQHTEANGSEAISRLAARFGEMPSPETALEPLHERLARIEQRDGTLAERFDTLANRTEELSRELDQVREGSRRSDADLSARLDALPSPEESLRSLQEQLAETRAISAVEADRIETLTRRLEAVDSVLSESRAATRQIEETIAGLPPALDSLQRMDRLLAGNRADLEGLAVRLGRVESLADQDTALLALETSLADLDQRFGDMERMVAGFDEQKAGMESRFDESARHLGQLDSKTEALSRDFERIAALVERVSALEQQAVGLETVGQERGEKLAALSGRLESLGAAVHESAELIGQEAERLAALTRRVESDAERIERSVGEQARQRDELEKLWSRLERVERLQSDESGQRNSAMETIGARIANLEQAREGLDGTVDRLNEALHSAIDDLNAVRQQTSGLARSLEPLDGLPERVRELEERDERQRERQDGYDETARQLRQLVDGLEQTAGEQAERIEAEALRIVAQEKMQEGERDRLNLLSGEMEQYGLDLSEAMSRIKELQEADGARSTELQRMAATLESLERQDAHLDKVLTAAQEKLTHLAARQDAMGEQVERAAEDAGAQDLRIGQLRSGIRRLAGIAVAAGLVLLGAGFVLFRFGAGDVGDKLAVMKSRLDDVAATAPPAQEAISGEVESLRQEVRILGNRFQDLPAGDERELERLEQDYSRHKTNAIQALDEVNERLARLEQQPQPAVAETSPPRRGAVETKDAAAVAENLWERGQRLGRYTLQLVGVSSEEALARFVRARPLGDDIAFLETRRQGQPWYVLFKGVYPTRARARAAARELGPRLPTEPWVRRLPPEGRIESVR